MNLGKTYAKLAIFPKIFLKIGPQGPDIKIRGDLTYIGTLSKASSVHAHGPRVLMNEGLRYNSQH